MIGVLPPAHRVVLGHALLAQHARQSVSVRVLGRELMSALGHEQTSRHVRVMSVIPLKADIQQRGLHVRLVPQADIYIAGW